MKNRIFYPGDYPKSVDMALLILRLAAGAFMLTHGAGKFSKLFGDEPILFADPLGLGANLSLALTVFSEVLCSLFIIFGWATRLSAIPLLITMAVAAFVVHAGDGFGKQELPAMYAVVYLFIAVAGAGKISIDHWLYQKQTAMQKKEGPVMVPA
ncbi:MAG: DoxX family protein [Bacteroidia bacterium]|nr:DoxX family protein [Bacteroidia bacterium]